MRGRPGRRASMQILLYFETHISHLKKTSETVILYNLLYHFRLLATNLPYFFSVHTLAVNSPNSMYTVCCDKKNRMIRSAYL